MVTEYKFQNSNPDYVSSLIWMFIYLGLGGVFTITGKGLHGYGAQDNVTTEEEPLRTNRGSRSAEELAPEFGSSYKPREPREGRQGSTIRPMRAYWWLLGLVGKTWLLPGL